MRKFLFLSLIFCALIATTANAQDGGPVATKPTAPPPSQPTAEQIAVMVKEAKEKHAPPMAAKTGITLAKAERVIEINWEIRVQASAALQGLNDADRTAKLAEFKALKEKKMSEALTPDEVKAVNAYYEEMGKNAPQKREVKN